MVLKQSVPEEKNRHLSFLCRSKSTCFSVGKQKRKASLLCWRCLSSPRTCLGLLCASVTQGLALTEPDVPAPVRESLPRLLICTGYTLNFSWYKAVISPSFSVVSSGSPDTHLLTLFPCSQQGFLWIRLSEVIPHLFAEITEPKWLNDSSLLQLPQPLNRPMP